MQLHKLACSYISLHAVTKAYMQLHKLACSYISWHTVPWASCVQFPELSWSLYIKLHKFACSYIIFMQFPSLSEQLTRISQCLFCDNYKDLLFIGKLMPRQFQNTPYTWILLRNEGSMTLEGKAYCFNGFIMVPVRISDSKLKSLNLFQLYLVHINKSQCPLNRELSKFFQNTPNI